MRSILFFVNSFGKGGAERVCVNLGEEYVKQGYKHRCTRGTNEIK